MQTILNKAAALWRKTNTTQLLRHGVQLLAFLLFPGLFLTVFNALKEGPLFFIITSRVFLYQASRYSSNT